MNKCRWCDQIHGPRCPQVKAIEFADDGVTVKRVEFVTAVDVFGISPVHPLRNPWDGTSCGADYKPRIG